MRFLLKSNHTGIAVVNKVMLVFSQYCAAARLLATTHPGTSHGRQSLRVGLTTTPPFGSNNSVGVLYESRVTLYLKT